MERNLVLLVTIILLASCRKESPRLLPVQEIDNTQPQLMVKTIPTITDTSDIDGSIDLFYSPCAGEYISVSYSVRLTSRAVYVGNRWISTFNYHFTNFLAQGTDTHTPYTVTYTQSHNSSGSTIDASRKSVDILRFVLKGPAGQYFSFLSKARFMMDANQTVKVSVSEYQEECH